MHARAAFLRQAHRNGFSCSRLSRQVAPPGSETLPNARSNGEQPPGSPGNSAGALLLMAFHEGFFSDPQIVHSVMSFT